MLFCCSCDDQWGTAVEHVRGPSSHVVPVVAPTTPLPSSTPRSTKTAEAAATKSVSTDQTAQAAAKKSESTDQTAQAPSATPPVVVEKAPEVNSKPEVGPKASDGTLKSPGQKPEVNPKAVAADTSTKTNAKELSFQIEMDKGTEATWGMDIKGCTTKNGGCALRVVLVKDGLIQKWNDANPDAKLLPDMHIVSVNGKNESISAMLEALKGSSQRCKIVVSRNWPHVS